MNKLRTSLTKQIETRLSSTLYDWKSKSHATWSQRTATLAPFVHMIWRWLRA